MLPPYSLQRVLVTAEFREGTYYPKETISYTVFVTLRLYATNRGHETI